MKRVPIAVITLIVVFTVTFLNLFYITDISGEIISFLEESEKAALLADVEGVCTNLAEAKKRFDAHYTYFGTVVRHSELDEALLLFYRLEALATEKKTEDYAVECHYLTAMFHHIQEMESFSPANIL